MRFLPLRAVALGILVPIVVGVQGCQDPNAVEAVSASLKNTETYRYAMVGGDEDGARISTQAKHYGISEIRRDSATGWVMTYVYQPAPGFVGSDYVEIEVITGSDGASPPTNIKRVALHFAIHD
jgi:hypothetical protein